MSLGCGDKRVNVIGPATVGMVMTLSVLYRVFWVSWISLAIKSQDWKVQDHWEQSKSSWQFKTIQEQFIYSRGEAGKVYAVESISLTAGCWRSARTPLHTEGEDCQWKEKRKKKKSPRFWSRYSYLEFLNKNGVYVFGKNVIILGKGDKNRRL